MAGYVGRRRGRAIANINITPFVDVVLVLLVVLMVRPYGLFGKEIIERV